MTWLCDGCRHGQRKRDASYPRAYCKAVGRKVDRVMAVEGVRGSSLCPWFAQRVKRAREKPVEGR